MIIFGYILSLLIFTVLNVQSQIFISPTNYQVNSAYNANWPQYNDDGVRLIDGQEGSFIPYTDWSDKWTGWLNYTDNRLPFIQPELLFNFDSRIYINKIQINFCRHSDAAIYLPEKVFINSDMYLISAESIPESSTGWISFDGNWTGNNIVIKTDGFHYHAPQDPNPAHDFTFISEVLFSVPEPSALSLLAVGLGGLATLRRRRS